MSGVVLVRQGVPLTLRLSKGEWNTFFNGLLIRSQARFARFSGGWILDESDHGQRRFNTIASRTPAFASCSSMTGVAAS
jgi:hypothetical protein